MAFTDWLHCVHKVADDPLSTDKSKKIYLICVGVATFLVMGFCAGKICVEISEYLKANGRNCRIYYGNRESNYEEAKLITRPDEVKIHSILFCAPKKQSDCANKFRILGVSAKWDKGSSKLNDFIKLAQILGENHEIRLIGQHSKIDNSLPPNICFVQYLNSYAELAKEHQSTDVYVHLSRGDSFGKVIVEAMSCGTPVGCYDNTACFELVPDECGIRVGTGNIDEVANAILKIQKKGVCLYRDNCLKKAQNYEKYNMLQKTLEVYQSMIVKGRRSI